MYFAVIGTLAELADLHYRPGHFLAIEHFSDSSQAKREETMRRGLEVLRRGLTDGTA